MKTLLGIFGVLFCLVGFAGNVGMLIEGMGGVNRPWHPEILGVYAFVLVLVAGILLVIAAEEKE